MTGLSAHTAFVAAAYGFAVVTLVGLVAWTLLDHRALKRTLADLDARGIRRRSADSATEK